MQVYWLKAKNSTPARYSWLATLQQYMCPECRALSKDVLSRGIDVDLPESPRSLGMMGVFPPVAAIIREEMLREIEGWAGQVMLGAVLVCAKECPGYVTVVAPKPLLVRGGPQSHRSHCSQCGRLRYAPTHERYVTKDALSGSHVFQAMGGGLIVTEDALVRFNRKKWKGVAVVNLPVLEKARDGIDHFPENYYYWGSKQV